MRGEFVALWRRRDTSTDGVFIQNGGGSRGGVRGGGGQRLQLLQKVPRSRKTVTISGGGEGGKESQ